MQIPRSYIDNYSKSLNVISEHARKKLADALAEVDYLEDAETVMAAVTAIMQQACRASTNVAAALAADFYNGLRIRFGLSDEYAAEAQSLRDPNATSGAVRAFVDDFAYGQTVDVFVEKCVGRIDYETRRAANECVSYNAKNDPARPRWARVPTGSETCQWCIMLASRGFDYLSEESASHTHANCDCRIVPSWDRKNPSVQGYDPDKYYDMYRHPENYPELAEARNARRRELRAERRNDEQARGEEPDESNAAQRSAMTKRQKLEADAKKVYIARGGGMNLDADEAERRFDLLVDGNTDAQLRQYINRYGK